MRKVPVRLWVVAVVVAGVMFLTYQAYLKPCQLQPGGPCNTCSYDYCCEATNMVCRSNKCIKLGLAPP